MNKKNLVIIIVSIIFLLIAIWGITVAVSLNSQPEPQAPVTEAPSSTPLPIKRPGKSGQLDENRYQGDVLEITETQISILVTGKRMTFDLTERTAQHIPILEIVVGDNIIVETEPGTTTVKLFEKILSET